MRIRLIRKGYPPPPQSDSTPLHHHTPHLLQPSDISPPDKNPQPSDLSIAAASGTNGVDSLDQTKNTRCTRGGSNQDPMLGDGEEEADAEEKPLVATNWRLDYSCGAETSAGGSPPSASPSHKGHWCEEDKLFPLKKRRASFTNNLRPRTETDKEQKESVTKKTRNREKIWVGNCDSENEEVLEGDAVGENYESKKRESERGGKKPVANWRCHRNSGSGRWRCNRPSIPGHSLCEHHLSQARVRDREKIWVEHCDSENEEELEDDAVGEKYEAKKRDGGGGGGKKPVANQRCHRNSGSGWRCSRPTILGLSLCEHHLSQARVKNRNYARIRNRRNGPKKNINNVKKVYTSLYLEAEEEEEEEWDDVDDKGFEKRGVIKARSINSLLSQTVPKYTTIKGNALTV